MNPMRSEVGWDEPLDWYEWRTAPGPYPHTTLSDIMSFAEFQARQQTPTQGPNEQR